MQINKHTHILTQRHTHTHTENRKIDKKTNLDLKAVMNI